MEAFSSGPVEWMVRKCLYPLLNYSSRFIDLILNTL